MVTMTSATAQFVKYYELQQKNLERRQRISRMGAKRRALYKLATMRKYNLKYVSLTDDEIEAFYGLLPFWKRWLHRIERVGHSLGWSR